MCFVDEEILVWSMLQNSDRRQTGRGEGRQVERTNRWRRGETGRGEDRQMPWFLQTDRSVSRHVIQSNQTCPFTQGPSVCVCVFM